MDREIRLVVRDEKTEWRTATSGVPQGSVLAPIMFFIYINDMPEEVSSYMSMFADDIKPLRGIKEKEVYERLQNNINEIHEWNKQWEMEFNTKKCHIMRIGKSKNRPRAT